MLWNRRKSERENTKQDNEVWDKLLKILQLLEVKVASLESKYEDLRKQVRSIDIKYGKLMKLLDEEEEESQVNQTDNSLNRNILGGL